MPVVMTLEVRGDPSALERFSAENKEMMQGVLEVAKQRGLIAHRFYGSEDGSKILVADVWPDRQSFETFFREQQAVIGPMFDAVGATSAPDPTYWRELSTNDAFGWGA